MGEATGEPIKIGVQNLEGDPNGSFPEFSIAIQAAADYVNAELGGLGGRPIEIVLCKSVVSPDDSQRCANELAADEVELAISTINFFGNHFSIYQGSDIPVLVVTPVTIADFTSEGVYAIGAGGGCLGVHTGLVQFATDEIEELRGHRQPNASACRGRTRLRAWSATTTSRRSRSTCSTARPPATPMRAGSDARPDLHRRARSHRPPRMRRRRRPRSSTSIPTSSSSRRRVPTAGTWSTPSAVLGWTRQDIPLVLSGACTDFTAMEAAGDLVDGIYITSR